MDIKFRTQLSQDVTAAERLKEKSLRSVRKEKKDALERLACPNFLLSQRVKYSHEAWRELQSGYKIKSCSAKIHGPQTYRHFTQGLSKNSSAGESKRYGKERETAARSASCVSKRSTQQEPGRMDNLREGGN